jgi:hypothetical protein
MMLRSASWEKGWAVYPARLSRRGPTKPGKDKLMITSTIRRLACVATMAAAAVLGGAGAATAADQTIDLPAGDACEFGLRIEITGGNQVMKTFTDKNGTVRSLSAGTGSALTFTNLDAGTSLSLKSNGSVTQIRSNPDGSVTYKTTGHNVLVLFPSDIPAGPSTTLTVGQTVFTVDPSGVFTVLKVSGNSTDICAALAA